MPKQLALARASDHPSTCHSLIWCQRRFVAMAQSLWQPSLPPSLADDDNPPYDSPPWRSRSTTSHDFELPRWQRKETEELDDSSTVGSSSLIGSSKSLCGSPSGLTPGDSVSNVGDNCESHDKAPPSLSLSLSLCLAISPFR